VTRTDKDLPIGDEKVATVRAMFDRVARRYDLVNRVMTFGMDVGWRRRTVRELRLPGGARVVDLACGTGDLCNELERNGYCAIGFDFSSGMLVHATTSASLVQADVLRLPLADGTIDGATCGFALRNVTDVRSLFAEAARVLRHGGRAAFLETSEPAGRLMRAGHRAYFGHVVPLIGGALSDRDAYRYLPRSMAYLPQPDQLVETMRSVGFGEATRVPLAGGIAQIVAGTRS
jgi:demethylmenaquinone methyltransferase / 2-methoxy-6-polyprenyl-1,4-benzoquinol methylase